MPRLEVMELFDRKSFYISIYFGMVVRTKKNVIVVTVSFFGAKDAPTAWSFLPFSNNMCLLSKRESGTYRFFVLRKFDPAYGATISRSSPKQFSVFLT